MPILTRKNLIATALGLGAVDSLTMGFATSAHAQITVFKARNAGPDIAPGAPVVLSSNAYRNGGMMMKLVIGACALLLAPAAAAQETTTYSYDALGRLKTTSTSGGQNDGTVNQVEFDRAGNGDAQQWNEGYRRPAEWVHGHRHP